MKIRAYHYPTNKVYKVVLLRPGHGVNLEDENGVLLPAGTVQAPALNEGQVSYFHPISSVDIFFTD